MAKSTDIFSLPVRGGGLNLLLYSDRCCEYSRSIRMCEPFSEKSVVDAEDIQNNVIPEKNRKTTGSARKKSGELWTDELNCLNRASKKGHPTG